MAVIKKYISNKYYFVGILFVLRLIISLTTANYSFDNDESIYITIINNIQNHFIFSFTFIPGGKVYFLDYQWFTPVFYLPFIAAFGSKLIIIIVNNITFTISVYLIVATFFKCVKLNKAHKYILFALYMFFPLFFKELTNTLLSDGLFISLLSLIVFVSLYDKSIKWFYYILVLILNVCFLLTRPVGMIFIFISSVILLFKKRYLLLMLSVLAVFLAFYTNNYIRDVSVGKDKYVSYNIVQIIYFSNAVTSDGSTDNFLPRHYLSDTTYLKYDKKIITEDELLKELIVQVYNNPEKYFKILKDKTLNYLFHVWPYSWQYPNTQSANNKYYVIFFTFYYIFIIFGLFKLIRTEKYYSLMYISLFVLNFLYHIILIARFRYYLPIVYISIPILYFGFYHFIKYLYYKYFYHNSSINKIYLFVFKYFGMNKL